MTVLASKFPTLIDWAKALDPDGSISAVAELLSQTNDIMLDAVWQEGNLATGHRSTVRTGLPVATWRRLYGGVQPTKSTREQVTDSIGMLENYNEVDMALADLANNRDEFRLSEATATLEGMTQQLADTIFYGNSGANPERFTGLAARYNTRVVASAASAENVIHGGGAGADNRSIWLVGWGPQTCFLAYPKGSKAGLRSTDKGQVTTENIDGLQGRAEIYRMHFRVDCGLVLRDWRYCVRIANIDFSDLTADASGASANLPRLMFQALRQIPNLSMCKPAFYMPRDVFTKFDQQCAEATKTSVLKAENVGGLFLESFNGVPVRRCDRLAADEATVV